MRNILLSTTALTMTAGIAAAEISMSGSFKLGFNDTGTVGTALVANVYGQDPTSAVSSIIKTAGAPASADYVAGPTGDNNHGVYNDAGLTFAMSSTMDSGMTAGITVDMEGTDLAKNKTDGYTFALASDGLNLTFGTTEYSAITNWVSAGPMGTDTWANQNADNKNVLRADVTLGGLAISASANVSAGAKASPDPLSITVAGSLGGATYVVASEGSKMGVSVSNAVGGATLTTAYSTAPTLATPALPAAQVAAIVPSTMSTSTGVKIAYPMGAITTTAAYVMESVGATGDAIADSWEIAAVYSAGGTSVTFKTDDNSTNSVEGSAALGGATVFAGLADGLNDMYLAVSNPLGGGASIMASYAIDKKVADGGTDASDEVGAGDYQEGLTVELKFAF